ncbi:MAG: hypothetical protein PHW04_07945 [Candidatus Wallbacteria bacterium]|nr:hypothetical protein [Candidatus Wallbacteria bacterium]
MKFYPHFLFLFALFLSGAAGLINEIVWQRALKIYFSGAEAVPAMLVVLSFMAGLGLGSLAAGRRSRNLGNPVRALSLIEILLFSINLLICLLLSLNFGDSLYAVQRMALLTGIPLKVVYGVCSFLLLSVPCCLMGLTLPIAAEVFQRQFGFTDRRKLDFLIFFNTAGATLGCLLCGIYFLPYLGQLRSLILAAVCNLSAAVIFALLKSNRPSCCESPLPARSTSGLKKEEILGFLLGFLALSYEMYLFRILQLSHGPLPYTFTVILFYFLLFWNLGVLLNEFVPGGTIPCLAAAGAMIIAMPRVFEYERFSHQFSLFFGITIYFLPCLVCGIVFARILKRHTELWGSDVGRFMGLNTFGSCLGIFLVTIFGLQLNFDYLGLMIGIGYLSVCLLESDYSKARLKFALTALIVLEIAIYCAALSQPVEGTGARRYFGREGVVEILRQSLLVIWNGLGHSSLSVNQNHLGSGNWYLGVIPFLCHEPDNSLEVLVVGLGAGITSATIAKSGSVASVDNYEINEVLKLILRDYPDGTLRVSENPKCRIFWQDARTGLALNPKKYDLIVQQPLYLMQAGSSLLLSREYLLLLKSRLRERGLICIYCNSMGCLEQYYLVLKTVQSVFSHCLSFGGFYLLIASDYPFEYTRESVMSRLSADDELCREILGYKIEQVLNYMDTRELSYSCPYLITDDSPLVEYPEIVKKLVRIQ